MALISLRKAPQAEVASIRKTMSLHTASWPWDPPPVAVMATMAVAGR